MVEFKLDSVCRCEPWFVTRNGERFLLFKFHCKLNSLYNVLLLTLCCATCFVLANVLYDFIVGYLVHDSIIERRPITVYDYKIHRFIGENISLLCEPGFNPDDVTYTWLLNGSEITPDSRHHFYTPHHSHQMLWVLHLNEKDFGEYSCEIKYKNGRRLINLFFVHRIYEIHKQVVVPIGQPLVVYILIDSLQGNYRLFYTVNDGPQLHTMMRLGCSRFTHIYLNEYWRFIGPNSSTVKYSMCPSPDNYGYYRFYIRSQTFNPALNERESTVVQLPLVYHVMVAKSTMYDNPIFNISTITSGPLKPNEITEGHIKAETDTFFWVDTILIYCFTFIYSGLVAYLDLHVLCLRLITRPLWRNPVYIKDNQTSLYQTILYFVVLIVFEIVWPGIGYSPDLIQYIFILIFFLYSSDVIIIFNVIIPTKSNETPSLCGIPPMCELKQTYDIYLSYTDDDMNFVRDTILPFLEGNALKVFFRERDILPGQPDLTGCEKAICESKAFLVLATSHYVNDFGRNNIELPMIRYIVNISNKTPSNIVLILFTSGLSWNRCVFHKYTTIKLKRKLILRKTEKTNITSWLNKL